MADVKPLKLAAVGGGDGELREFVPGDTVPNDQLSANLAAFGGLTGLADRLPYFTGAGALSLAVLTAQARTLLAAITTAAQRTAMGLGDVATATVQSSATDSTAGRVLVMQGSGLGPFGLGGIPPDYSDANGVNYSGLGRNAALNAANAPNAGVTTIIGMPYAVGMATLGGQLGLNYTNDSGSYIAYPRLFARSKVGAATFGSWIEYFSSGNSAILPLSGDLAPATDNNRNCGAAARRWGVVYAGTGSINTSDAREKTAVRGLTASELAAASELAREIGAYQFLAAVAEKGAAARQHIGMTVQRAIEIMQAHALDPFAYGFICYDSWGETRQEHPDQYQQLEVLDPDSGEVVGYEQGEMIRAAWSEVTQAAGDRFSFRMDELLAFIARGQTARLEALEARLAALESTG